ncbi:MAG TPA: cytochrome c peroxidase [Phycisphaerales bacterium]|nr:cytochrome c peroxidase [Phycisphaerales bacterium]
MRRRPVLTLTLLALGAPAVAAQPPLGPPVAPPGNPVTEPKRLLGKTLFWDEQLSSSNTVSCGTCHTPEAGGGDPRRARNAGADLVMHTADDVFGSPGLIGADEDNNFSPVQWGGVMFASQVTVRSSNSAYMGAYSPLNFWDGRAGPALVDPVTEEVVLAVGAALEAQSLQPPVSTVEMAHFGRSWPQILDKLATAQPLALADQLPPDLAADLAAKPGYPALFERAFGTPGITAPRVAMALATYQRTLIPNQTPWDRYVAGEAGALTPLQFQGLAVFNSPEARCADCHAGNRFTNNLFHNIGVRPAGEDPGRESVTGAPWDLGKFRTPTLRNVGLRGSFFHNGQAQTLREVVDFYSRASGAAPRFEGNLDPAVLGISITPEQTDALVDFMAGALTDPRVAAAQFPFDKPRLWSQRPDLAPLSLGGGLPAAGMSHPPLTIASDPALIGEPCRIGVGRATVGASASLRVSHSLPVAGVVSGGIVLQPLTVSGEGAATARLNVDPLQYPPGAPLYVQWEVRSGPGGALLSRSDAARIVPFCARVGCPCPADLASQGGVPGPDGRLDNNDFVVFIDAYFAQSPAADLGRQGGLTGRDGAHDNNDFVAFIDLFFAGCG